MAFREPDIRYSSEQGEELFRSFSTDVENLGVFQPMQRRSDLLCNLLDCWQSDYVFNANCSDLYRNIRQIRNKFPRIKIIDHLFNTEWHFKDALSHHHLIDYFIVANELVREALLNGGVPDEKVRVVYHGIDTDRFSRSAAESRPSDRPFTAGYVGRLSEEKRPLDFVDALSGVPNTKGIIYGDGPLRAEVLEKIALHKMESRVSIRKAERGASLFREIDVLVVPSGFEGLPMVVLEALAMGIPVIATPVGAIPRVISENVYGSLFPIGDIGALQNELERRSSEQSEASHRRIRRQRIISDYSLQRCAREYAECFAEVLGRK